MPRRPEKTSLYEEDRLIYEFTLYYQNMGKREGNGGRREGEKEGGRREGI